MKKISFFALLIIKFFLFTAHAQQHHWLQYTTADGLVSNNVESVAIQDLQNIWIGTLNGLSHFDGRSFINYTTTNSNILGNEIFMIKFDSQNVYIFTNAGLSVFDGINFYNYPSHNSVPLTYIKDAVIDLQGNLWMCKNNDIFMYDGSQIIHYSNEMGQSMAVDSSNRIYSLTMGATHPTFNQWYRIFDGTNWNSDSIANYNYPVQPAYIDETESNQLFIWNRNANTNQKYFFAEVNYPFNLQTDSFKLSGITRNTPVLNKVKLDKNNTKWVITSSHLYSGQDTVLYSHAIPNMEYLNDLNIKDDAIAIGSDQGFFIGNIHTKPNHKSMAKELSINQIKTNINNLGLIFEPTYAPKDSNSSFVYTSNFVVAAKKSNSSSFNLLYPQVICTQANPG